MLSIVDNRNPCRSGCLRQRMPGLVPQACPALPYRGRSGMQGLQTALAPLSLAQRTLRAIGASLAQDLQRIPPCTSHLPTYEHGMEALVSSLQQATTWTPQGLPSAKQFLAERVAVHLGCPMNPCHDQRTRLVKIRRFRDPKIVDNLLTSGVSSTIDSTSHVSSTIDEA